MKIRKGFVSNSSSSSFHLYGTAMEECDFKEIIIEKKLVDEEKLEEYGLGEILDDIDISGLEILHMYDCETVYLGRYYSSIGENETGKEFKRSVKEALKKFLGKDISCDEYEESWYNG